MWQYVGRNWFRHGLIPYRGGVDNKSPLIFAIFGLSDKFFGVNFWFPRILGTVCQSIGIFFVYKIAVHISNKRAAMISIIIYSLSLLWHSTGGKYISYTETYAVTCIIISVYKFLTSEKNSGIFVSGLFAGLAIAFRIPACFAVLFLLIVAWKNSIKSIMIFSFGIIVSVGLFFLMMELVGISIKDFIIFAVADNF